MHIDTDDPRAVRLRCLELVCGWGEASVEITLAMADEMARFVLEGRSARESRTATDPS